MDTRQLNRTQRKHIDIMKAAVELFQKNGFDSTSMDSIALNAKVSKRTIYKHFSDKDFLFQSIIKHLFEEIMNTTSYPYSAKTSLEKQLTEIAKLLVEFLTSECLIKLSRVVLVELIRSPQKAQEAFFEFNEEEIGITKWIVEAKKDKRLKVLDVAIASKQFIALLKAFAFWPHILEGKPLPTLAEKKKLIQETVRCFLKAYQ